MSSKTKVSIEEVLNKMFFIPVEQRSAEFKVAYKKYKMCLEKFDKYKWELVLASSSVHSFPQTENAEKLLKAAEKSLISSTNSLIKQFQIMNKK